jgi:hypothetical protein
LVPVLNTITPVHAVRSNFLRPVLTLFSLLGLRSNIFIYVSLLNILSGRSSIYSAWLSKEDEIGEACTTNGKKKNAYGLLVGKPEGKIPLVKQRNRWVDNIKMDNGEMGWIVFVWL